LSHGCHGRCRTALDASVRLGRLHALACEKVVWLDSAINAAWPLFHYGSDGWVRVPQSVQARLAARIVAGAVVALRATALLLTLRP
jgi:hypothetical protein